MQQHKVTYVRTVNGERVYWHDFTTGHQELVFPDNASAKRFESALNKTTKSDIK